MTLLPGDVIYIGLLRVWGMVLNSQTALGIETPV